MLKQEPIYVELPIQAKFSELWDYTQDPEKHQEWDLRFSEIQYLPKTSLEEPQMFLYRTNIGFGLNVSGKGKTTGTRYQETGESASALTFWSDHPISLIEKGSGYWKYSMNDSGFHFKTWYDYHTRFGAIGKFVDAMFFRPLIGWATAWSFDCLRLWLEKNIHPRISFRLSLLYVTLSVLLGVLWIYQGLVPKLLFPESGELAILQSTGLFKGMESVALQVFGMSEIVFGLMFLLIKSKILHWLNIIALVVLGIGAAISLPALYTEPFNPATLTLAMAGLSIASLMIIDQLPTAKNCIRKQGAV